MRNKVPVMGIKRHCIDTDGNGVRTLVGFMGCPLNCAYCINNQCHDFSNTNSYSYYSVSELYEKIKIDNLYFNATGGGVTFGGGEPGLYSKYISDFRTLCPKSWTICIETSLNFDLQLLTQLCHDVDYFIVDIKEMSSSIYHDYTLCSNHKVIQNLRYLVCHGWSSKTKVRVPYIPRFNTKNNVANSINQLEQMGFTDVETFPYYYTENYHVHR